MILFLFTVGNERLNFFLFEFIELIRRDFSCEFDQEKQKRNITTFKNRVVYISSINFITFFKFINSELKIYTWQMNVKLPLII